jgi:replicative DNA helicase
MTDTLVDLEAERVLLGAVILSNALLAGVEGNLRPDHFASSKNRAIYTAMLALSEGGRPIDTLTLRDELQGEADVPYLAALTDDLPRVQNVEGWASLVRDKARRRAALKLGERLTQQAQAQDVDTDELLDRHQASVSRLMESTASTLQPLSDVLEESIADLEKFAVSATGLTGAPTGIPKLDRMTGGLQAGALYVLGAYTGRGKSALSAQIAVHAASRGARVLMFTLEMPPRQVGVRMLLADSGVDKWDLRTQHGRNDEAWGAVVRSHAKLSPLWIWLDKTEAPSLAHVRSTARKLKAREGLDLVIVDYLQRMAVDTKLDRWLAVGENARGLKGLAMACKCAVWAPCQLNAEAEGQRPGLHNLGQAQSIIGAESDLIAFLHPEDLERWKTQPFPAVSLHADKNRSGPSFTVDLSFEKSHSRFVEVVKPRLNGVGG